MAAAKGNNTAMRNIGLMYEKGQGVSQNRQEAVKWYKAAADKGNEKAKEALARIGY